MTFVGVPRRLRDHVVGKSVIVVLVAAYTLMVSVGGYWTGWATLVDIVCVLGLCLPWAVSHRWPRLCFAVMAVAGLVQLITAAAPVPAEMMLLAGVHALAVYSTPLGASVGALTVVSGSVVGAVLWGDSLTDVAVPLLAIIAATCAAWTWGRSVAVGRAYQESLVQRAAQLEREQEHLAQIATSAERERIARDLHDVVSHSLAGVLTLSEATLRTSDDLPEPLRDTFERIATYCRASLVEFRTVLSLLRESESGQPSPTLADIEKLVESMESVELSARLTMRTVLSTPSAAVQETVYRVVQEALTNVRKHAGHDVSEVAVTIDATADGLDVEIRDDGKGCSASKTGGYGLRGMRERVDSLSGTLATGPSDRGGFVVRACIPHVPPGVKVVDDHDPYSHSR